MMVSIGLYYRLHEVAIFIGDPPSLGPMPIAGSSEWNSVSEERITSFCFHKWAAQENFPVSLYMMYGCVLSIIWNWTHLDKPTQWFNEPDVCYHHFCGDSCGMSHCLKNWQLLGLVLSLPWTWCGVMCKRSAGGLCGFLCQHGLPHNYGWIRPKNHRIRLLGRCHSMVWFHSSAPQTILPIYQAKSAIVP